MKNDLVQKNPTLKIVTPKIAKKLPEFVQEKNMASIFDNILDGEFEDFRNRLIIEFFYSTGIRRIELINISDNDIDRANRVVKVLGKGNKERIIPLSDDFLSKIDKYLSLRDDYFDNELPSETLFVTNKGSKMYPKLVYNIVKSYLSTVTTAEKKSPHILRHTFATHMMNQGADLNAVKELLGHANLAATQIYTHNSIEKLKEVYKKAHPKSDKK
jgi:integrase/recombinase XerC